MSTHLDESAIEVRYLLGELSAAEAESFEHSFVADERLFEDLEASESEVIDAYVAKKLTSKQRQHFRERVSRSPRLQERVAFASAFAQSTAAAKTAFDPVSDRPAVRESWWKKIFLTIPVLGPLTPAGALATIVIVLPLTAVIVQSIRLRNESQRLAGERVALEHQRDELARLAAEERNRTVSELRDAQARVERAEQIVRELQQHERESQPPKQQSIIAALTLMPGSGNRSGGAPDELFVSPRASEVHLKLALLNVDYRSYQVTIDGPTSTPINRVNLKPTRKTLLLRLPANLFSPGQYTVQVSGVTANHIVETVSTYSFKVVRSQPKN